MHRKQVSRAYQKTETKQYLKNCRLRPVVTPIQKKQAKHKCIHRSIFLQSLIFQVSAQTDSLLRQRFLSSDRKHNSSKTIKSL